MLPVAGFVAFVLWNGSIVVGDHSNHQAVTHWAQLAYLSAASLSLWGLVGEDAAITPRSPRSAVSAATSLWSWCLVLLAAFLLNRYSLAHPFLLADNRHYTFYIWNRFLGRRRFLKEALAPVYCYAAWQLSGRLSRAQSPLWTLIWWLAAALTLVPAHLLEPRYWTAAVLLAHAHSQERSWLALAATGFGCMVVNVITLALFLWRPFQGADGEIARFMW